MKSAHGGDSSTENIINPATGGKPAWQPEKIAPPRPPSAPDYSRPIAKHGEIVRKS